MSARDYDKFLAGKIRRHHSSGFTPVDLNKNLFPWQSVVTEWASRQGKAALFCDTGLGKTAMQLAWADQVCRHTKGSVLILCPLAVAAQTVREGVRFGINVTRIKSMEDVTSSGIYITNYDRMKDIDPDRFTGVVLDESSVLKAFTGKTRIALTSAFAEADYRLCCTATPAPNDYMELGQHAEFLGVCSCQQMLATWFINDTFDTGDWRLKRHSVAKFWEWVSSWAACISKPSDIGFADDGYDLPALNMETITVKVDQVDGREEGELFRMGTMSATTIHRELKHTCAARSSALAKIVNGSTEQWGVWCNTNQEADELKALIPDALEVRGDHTAEFKEKAVVDFQSGVVRVLLSKASIFGFGINMQHCHNVAFVGLSYSFEDFYQALRRFYRFGQTHEVRAVVVQAETEGAILETIKRKIAAHDQMKSQMKFAAEALRNQTHQLKMKTEITTHKGKNWTLHHGDCVRVARTLKSESVGFSVFSPPFKDLFVYSDDEQDMGNCADGEEFKEQFGFLVEELFRVTMQGRECAVHVNDMLSTKWKDGQIEFTDFSGDIVSMFRKRGWLLHSRITIWKDPVTEMQRTKAHGLLYKTLRGDSSKSRVGAPEYLLVFRKPGDNPKPITHTPEDFPLDLWQEIASPVWMTIDQGNVLNKNGAKDEADERHICPLQLDVIERALKMWSAPDDLVFSPFTGIGSEGVMSLRAGRRFVGAELKASYVKQAAANLENATAQLKLL